MAFEQMRIFTGNANPKLAEAVCRHLNISLGRCTVGRFSDGEVLVELMENVRGREAFVLQSTCAPTNDNLMEILVMVDALKRASAGRITAAIPYLGYARQDRRPRSARVAITAKVVADMITTVGVNRVMVMDLHADQIQGFFNIPVDNIYATPILLGDLWQRGEPDWLAACAQPNVKLHLYGKRAARAGRKMGHLTALAATADEAAQLARAARAALTRPD